MSVVRIKSENYGIQLLNKNEIVLDIFIVVLSIFTLKLYKNKLRKSMRKKAGCFQSS